jgi:hypothetical protein
LPLGPISNARGIAPGRRLVVLRIVSARAPAGLKNLVEVDVIAMAAQQLAARKVAEDDGVGIFCGT